MMTPLLYLALASLFLAPALTVDSKPPMEYYWFRYYHTVLYRFGTIDCNNEMRYRQRARHSENCRGSSVMILGDTTDAVSQATLRNICRGEGTSVDNDMIMSTKTFRLVKCTLQNKDGVRPNCMYKPSYMKDQITVGCQQGYPVHLDGSE